jgi:putative glycosyltransferase (exosortase G-associated)
MKTFFQEMMFWGVWLIISLIIDIVIGCVQAIYLAIEYLKPKPPKALSHYPLVSIIVPVFNSEKTLKSCVESIINQSYPLSSINILLVDNGSTDGSRDIYHHIQDTYPDVRLWWLMTSEKGKSKALNEGIYAAKGRYIINVDSDGMLDKDAVFNVIYNFETNSEIYAQTGVVLIDTNYLKEEKNIFNKMFKNCELFEYCESFMIGRGVESKTNSMFTLAGAFSCFRKEILYKTQLYNGETLGEDTHMTTQIRDVLKGKVVLCEDAFFYVDPIESMDKLYTQRQRWQRGGIEVSSLFHNFSKKGLNKVFFSTMLKDHTFAFPRLIWMFAMIYLIAVDYPMKLIIGANFVMYLAYVGTSFLYFMIARMKLKNQFETKKYVTKHFYTIFLLPIYRVVLYFIRVAGIINAVEENVSWNKRTFSQEVNLIQDTVKSRFSYFYVAKRWINNG